MASSHGWLGNVLGGGDLEEGGSMHIDVSNTRGSTHGPVAYLMTILRTPINIFQTPNFAIWQRFQSWTSPFPPQYPSPSPPNLVSFPLSSTMSHAGHGGSTTGTTATGGHEGMTPYLHFAGGDYLYFSAWKPSSPGAIAGACIGLFVLALFERWFAALRGVFEHHWKHRALLLSSRYSSRPERSDLSGPNSRSSSSSSNKGKVVEAAEASPIPPLIPRYRGRTIPPFVASQDIPRGIMYAFHMFLGYLLMLAVMTFHAGIIISIVVGLGVGETIFGRVASGSLH